MRYGILFFIFFGLFSQAEKKLAEFKGTSTKQTLFEETEASISNPLKQNALCCGRAHKGGSFQEASWKPSDFGKAPAPSSHSPQPASPSHTGQK